MSAKHTPGPWQFKRNKCSAAVYDEYGNLLARLPLTDITLQRRVADARLVAAAPALLQALLNLVGTMCAADGSDMDDDLDAIDARVGEARAAIAAATQERTP